jgi:hypothetical protein
MINPSAELDTARRAAAALTGGPARELARIGGGRNSQVYRVEVGDAERYVLKLYFRDDRKRRATEFNGLRFLWANDIRRIPEPLETDDGLSASLFSFIEGTPVVGPDATEADIDACADFLLGLRQLVHRPGAGRLPPAAEAMFSLDALAENIRQRLVRLFEVERKHAPSAEMHAFIRWQFGPSFLELTEWSREVSVAHGLTPAGELPLEMRTLSPSDFGFHNALRTPSGLAFVDFEYFGWDDPAKMLSDFLLHPGMAIAQPLRGRFLRRVLQGAGSAHALDARARIGYAMYGLKWCMILLNEFVPEHLERRLFNDPNLRVEDHQRQQLAKARAMLSQARAARDAFPYEEWIGS